MNQYKEKMNLLQKLTVFANDDQRKLLSSIMMDLDQFDNITKYNFFWMNESEWKAAKQFIDENSSEGTLVTYKFTPTGIGDGIAVEVQQKETRWWKKMFGKYYKTLEKNVTDTGRW